MLDSILQNLTRPDTVANMVTILLTLFAKDFLVGALRSLQSKLLHDKNKSNDNIGELAGVIADGLENVRSLPKK